LRAGQLTLLQGHHLGALDGAEGAGHLAVRRGEVVVPEKRHLLLERALRVDHPEQPPLPRVLDARVRGEPARARGDVDVIRPPDLAVHVVGLTVHVHQIGERFERGLAVERRQLRGAGAEAGSPQQVSEVFLVHCHM
jgi:hypothetical protein